MNEQAINQLKEGVRAVIQMIVERGEPLSDELKGLLAQAVEHVATRIQELRAEGAPQPEIELPPAPYPSSNIHAFQYDPKSKKLIVKFQDEYPKTNGPVYAYDNVPEFIYEIFSRGAVGPKTSGKNRWHRWKKGVTPSLGAAMSALVKKGGFPYRRLT